MMRPLCAFVLLSTLAVAQDTPAPLPAIDTLLHDVERNQDAADRAARDYTYHVHEEEQQFDNKGNVKKTETRDADSFRVDGVLVNRLTAKNGKPLTADEQKKEADRIDKVIEKEKARREKLRSEGKPTNDNGDQVLTVSRILQLGTFTNERRETLNGRPTIVVDYQGDPNAKTRTQLEKAFREIVGTVWIDEQDRAIAKLEGHFINDFTLGGGLLVNAKKGLTFGSTTTKVNDEVWLPQEVHADGRIRFLLFVNINGRFRLTTSDYKKYRASTTLHPTNREVDENGNPVPPPPEPQKQQ